MPETATLPIEKIVVEIVKTIDREREQEIISRRFGLHDRKETLEQIGELLGITRERVRQLEKAVIARLKSEADKGALPNLAMVQDAIIELLGNAGGTARISDIAEKLTKEGNKIDQSRVSFLAQLSPKIVTIDENDNYFHAAAVKAIRDEKEIKQKVEAIIKALKTHKEPVKSDKLAEIANVAPTKETVALASISKKLATLNGLWGLIKWPMVNPKNIRDKIYVILKENGKHLHFNEIAKAIKTSDFKRKDVTTQAIHNELIKDKRFVLIGRGIYALQEWGYKRGTVADIITEVLKKAKQPLHRDEIVKQVLKSRYVKETTILLNLQGKSQFKRVAKATYALAE
jgi:transcriptional regulator with XRE-family HTH domain